MKYGLSNHFKSHIIKLSRKIRDAMEDLVKSVICKSVEKLEGQEGNNLKPSSVN